MIIKIGADNILHDTAFNSAFGERTTYFIFTLNLKKNSRIKKSYDGGTQ
jgi:hypothetical protein